MTRQRLTLIVLATLGTILVTICVASYRLSQRHHLEPGQFLAHVVELEKDSADPNSLQALGWSLAILGRDHEVRSIDFLPNYDRAASTVDWDRLDLQSVAWKEGIERIAAGNRLVMIMEDHCASKHREFIGATLPIFHRGKFTHYAAEAIGADDRSLAERGYPSSRTGLYTSDPRFGNVLRRALALKFDVLGYDFRPFQHDSREEYAAAALGEIVQGDPQAKVLVHAGHAHVLKHTTALGERWLAARLWEKTGIEPFTIWQWSSNQASEDYAKLVHTLEQRGITFDEPLLLMPPPPPDCGLQDPPYGLARVDAIVLHPPDASIAPAARTVLFPAERQKLVGKWTARRWPVVVCAYKQGEPPDAIPLDQVLLRQNESEFVLWLPRDTEFQMRVFTPQGLIQSLSHRDGDEVVVGLEAGNE